MHPCKAEARETVGLIVRMGVVVVLGIVVAFVSACDISIHTEGQPAPSATIQVKGNGMTETRDCGDQTAVVDGTNNVVTFTGSCPSVAVWGTGNRVGIEAVDRIVVAGSGHAVTYGHGVRLIGPNVHINGSGNSVEQAAPKR